MLKVLHAPRPQYVVSSNGIENIRRTKQTSKRQTEVKGANALANPLRSTRATSNSSL